MCVCARVYGWVGGWSRVGGRLVAGGWVGGRWWVVARARVCVHVCVCVCVCVCVFQTELWAVGERGMAGSGMALRKDKEAVGPDGAPLRAGTSEGNAQ